MSSNFNERVWEVIRSIPPGKVMTYAEVANALGTKAYRAVGGACGKSPGMPDVPCHRVVSSDMRLHGFNGGIEKKRELLESEGMAVAPCTVKGEKDYRIVR